MMKKLAITLIVVTVFLSSCAEAEKSVEDVLTKKWVSKSMTSGETELPGELLEIAFTLKQDGTYAGESFELLSLPSSGAWSYNNDSLMLGEQLILVESLTDSTISFSYENDGVNFSGDFASAKE